MKLPVLVFRRGKRLIGFEFGAITRPQDNAESQWGARKLSTTIVRLELNPAGQHAPISNEGRDTLGNIGSRARGKVADRDLFLDVLSSTSTKREAKSYLSRFHPSKKSLSLETATQSPTVPRESDKQTIKSIPFNVPGVNLGSFYLPAKALDESPVFTQVSVSKSFIDNAVEPLHVALVKLRAPESLDDTVLQGIGHTLSQLVRLGLSCVIVVDCDESKTFDLDG
ncbi:MAG: Amino-acid acetyltransferase, mitochondrial, partial [Pleopsidium flavum]